jgi:hypothetical protein
VLSRTAPSRTLHPVEPRSTAATKIPLSAVEDTFILPWYKLCLHGLPARTTVAHLNHTADCPRCRKFRRGILATSQVGRVDASTNGVDRELEEFTGLAGSCFPLWVPVVASAKYAVLWARRRGEQVGPRTWFK